ncbi:hypothetical protein GCM10017744_003900 [Streptomyces antimycoticus]|uniref:Uncharacterized protein n=1 Tax=Streptomyces antimycoticus TaxID=68175 RepID=A0A4D4KJL0_9ACTN|nr:hypothetical protein SANT12839_095740 [Streptomyces antimycoticus]
MRDQASKVTYWVEHPAGRRENVKLHVLNRSPDPVSKVRLVLHVDVSDEEEKWVLDLSNLGPCTDTVYSASKMRLENIPRNHIASPDEWPKLSDQGYWGVGSMYFVDSSGRGWTRTSKDLDKSSSPPAVELTNIIWWNDEEVSKAGLCEGGSR